MGITDIFKGRNAKRQAERDSKKTGKSLEQIAFEEMITKNAEIANEIGMQAFKSLASYGFIIEGFMYFSDQVIKPYVKIWPMTYADWQEYEAATRKTFNTKQNEPTNGEGSGAVNTGLAQDEGVLGAESPQRDDAEGVPE